MRRDLRQGYLCSSGRKLYETFHVHPVTDRSDDLDAVSDALDHAVSLANVPKMCPPA